jgi:hypothetical protein
MGWQHLTPQQIQAIKNSRKGYTPPFITAGIGRAPGVVSLGASIGPPGKRVGGSVGMNNGQLFGTANVNGKIIGRFGPKKPNFNGE